MKNFLTVLLLFNSTLLFSLDCYTYAYSQNVTYAIAVAPSRSHDNEYIVGLLEIDPSGDERWTISTRTVITEDNTFKSKIDVNFPTIEINEDSIDVVINRKNNTIIHLSRDSKISYRNCDVIIPSVFLN